MAPFRCRPCCRQSIMPFPECPQNSGNALVSRPGKSRQSTPPLPQRDTMAPFRCRPCCRQSIMPCINKYRSPFLRRSIPAAPVFSFTGLPTAIHSRTALPGAIHCPGSRPHSPPTPSETAFDTNTVKIGHPEAQQSPHPVMSLSLFPPPAIPCSSPDIDTHSQSRPPHVRQNILL